MPLGFRMLYGCGRILFAVIFRGIFRTSIAGRERIPGSGGLLLVCNHISLADPPMVGVAMRRPVEFMTMAEMFSKPVLGWIVRTLRCIPVDRSRPDQSAAREAIRRLRAGHCVAIFPEAGIRQGEKSVLGGDPMFKPGAGSIAVLGNVPILPIIVRDTRKPYNWRNWFRRETMSVMFGYPFCLWIPNGLAADKRRQIAREMLRAELLKTVELI